jgi:hypothetical protein
MEPVEALGAGVKAIDELLEEAALEPDLTRQDWSEVRTRVRLLRDRFTSDVVAHLPLAQAAVDDTELRERIGTRVAALAGSVAAVAFAAGDTGAFTQLISTASGIATDADQRAELAAAGAEPETYVRLRHGWWLAGNDRRAEADKVWKAAARSARSPALKAAAKRGLNASRPITSAPTLFRLNGCGVGLYGERDRGPDGSYIATYCLSVLWIPVLPLTAYRVKKVDGNRYMFGTKEVLGPVTRAWRAGVVALGLGAAAWTGVGGYLHTPEHRAKVAFEDAKKAEASGDRETALQRYRDVVKTFAGQTDVEPAADAVVRLGAAALPEPCVGDVVDKAQLVTTGFFDLPESARRGAPVARLTKRLEACADQIGAGTTGSAEAGLAVLDLASRVAGRGPEATAIDDRRATLQRNLAERLEGERPLQALALYGAAGQKGGALGKARAILESFGDAPSLWLEAEHDVDGWLRTAKLDATESSHAPKIRAALEAARAAHALDAPLLEAGDEKAIAARLAQIPGDQELTAALAAGARRRGDAEGAVKRLRALGIPGRLTAQARQLLAACHADAGQLAAADDVLSGLLAERLPAFQQAVRDYGGAAERMQEEVYAELRANRVQPDLERALTGVPEERKKEVFQKWLRERLDKDPGLNALRAEYLRHEAVVPASLGLGMVKLRRANEISGEPRRALLADAERVFLSIRQEAEGDPSFHLGLGQVYHRLGRPKDGDVEYDRVLARKDAALTLAVASNYRELGIYTRSKQVAEDLYNTAPDTHWKQEAAGLLAHLVTEVGSNEEDEAMWLQRADTTSTAVKNLLQEAEARKLVREGKLAEADALYAKTAASYDEGSKHEPSSANNAAIAIMERYRTTGDPARLREAVEKLERAVRLAPQSALVVGNLASALDHAATVAVLERWVRGRTLLLDAGRASTLLQALASGPLHDEVLAAMAKEPTFRRSLDRGQEEQTLAPQKPTGYQRQLRWLDTARDAAGLEGMARRLDALPALDGSSEGHDRAAWETHAKDALLLSHAQKAAARGRERRDRAQQAGHGPTTAAAWLLLAGDLAQLAYVASTRELLDEMIDAHRKAAALWPEGGVDDSLPGALLVVALEHALPESVALRKAWEEEGRVYGHFLTLDRARAGAQGAEILSVMRRQPELAEAARLRRARMGQRPGLSDFILARLAGDAEMEREAAAAFTRKELGLYLTIEAKLSPGQRREEATLAMFRAGAGQK